MTNEKNLKQSKKLLNKFIINALFNITEAISKNGKRKKIKSWGMFERNLYISHGKNIFECFCTGTFISENFGWFSFRVDKK